MKPVRVVVCGVAGRMGGRILQAVRAEDGMQVVGATERPEAPQVGLDAGTAAGGPPLGVTVFGSLETALSSGAERLPQSHSAAAAGLRGSSGHARAPDRRACRKRRH